MSNKLYVVNLNFSITSAELIALFSSAGKVSIATIVRDKDTDRPRGFGFVTMEDEAGKLEAIKMFDGRLFKGRVIKVSEAVGTLVRETGNPANLHFVFKVSNSLTVVTPVQLNHVENINT